MVRNNNMIPNGHFHKNWQSTLRTWFDQPARIIRRKLLRQRKARRSAPQPIKPIRPIVRCPSFRYNSKRRLGRGFTHLELKMANINRKYAQTIGISVDKRRRNCSLETARQNATILQHYMSKLILFPKKKPNQVLKFDEKFNPAKKVIQADRKNIEQVRVVTEEEKSFSAYNNLRAERRKAKKKLKKARTFLENVDNIL